MNILLLGFVFLLAPLIIIAIVAIGVKVLVKKANKNSAKENNREIPKTVSAMEVVNKNPNPMNVAEPQPNSEVAIRYAFYDNETDKYLRKTFPNLRQWRSLGHPLGFKVNGEHLLELLFWDGSKKIVKVTMTCNIEFSIGENKEPEKTPEQVAEEWIKKWNSFMFEKHNKNEGFLIERKDLPDDNNIIEIISEKISSSGQFSTQLSECGLRFVVE